MSEPARLVAQFTEADALGAAVHRLKDAGFTRLEAYTPYAVEGLSALVGAPPARLPRWFVAGGLAGFALGYGVQLWGAALAYPINIGGRPLDSWPLFVPAANEVMILGAVLGGAAGLLRLAGLPRLHHPIFAVPGFESASDDGFFLAIELDAAWSAPRARRVLDGCAPLSIAEVAP